MPPLLRASSIARRFGRTWALHSVSLELAEGEAIALVGANGAGKSTLLSILSTLRRPSQGTLELFGLDGFKEQFQIRPRLGYLGHETFLDDALSAEENLEFYAELFDLKDAKTRVASQLESAGLAHRADDRVAGFSRGMRQRLSLARALLHDPELLFLDEPFSGLDAPGARDLSNRLAAERSRGRAMVVVTHQMTRVHGWCDRVMVLHRGKSVEDRPAADMGADEWAQHLAQVAEDMS